MGCDLPCNLSRMQMEFNCLDLNLPIGHRGYQSLTLKGSSSPALDLLIIFIRQPPLICITFCLNCQELWQLVWWQSKLKKSNLAWDRRSSNYRGNKPAITEIIYDQQVGSPIRYIAACGQVISTCTSNHLLHYTPWYLYKTGRGCPIYLPSTM